MKQQIRILGIDDSPFSFDDETTDVIAVVMRGGHYLECVLKRTIHIDGDEATTVLAEMIRETKHRKQLKAAMLDGVTMGGFNIIDIHKLYQSTNLPIITITRDEPDFKKIHYALKKHFPDWEKRWKTLTSEKPEILQTKHNPIYVQRAGISWEEAKNIITLCTIRGVIPEPLRVAHLIASGITRGESYGKA